MPADLDIKVAKLETEVVSIKEDVKDISHEIKTVHGRITEGNEKLMDKLSDMAKDADAAHGSIVERMNAMDKRINGRITVLEQWRWLVVGGAVVAGWIISNTGIIQNLFN